jgi:hypothetical protein
MLYDNNLDSSLLQNGNAELPANGLGKEWINLPVTRYCRLSTMIREIYISRVLCAFLEQSATKCLYVAD